MDIIKDFFRNTQWEKILTDPCILERLVESIGVANAIKVCQYWIEHSGEPTLSSLKGRVDGYNVEDPPTELLEQYQNQKETLKYVRQFIKANGGEE